MISAGPEQILTYVTQLPPKVTPFSLSVFLSLGNCSYREKERARKQGPGISGQGMQV